MISIYGWPLTISSGIFLGLAGLVYYLSGFLLPYPTQPKTADTIAIAYYGFCSPEAEIIQEEAQLWDTQRLLIPPLPVVAESLIYQPLTNFFEPVFPGCQLHQTQIFCESETLEPIFGLPNQAFLGLIDTMGQLPLQTDTVPTAPTLWAEYSRMDSTHSSSLAPIETKAPLTANLWLPIQFLVHIENDLVLGPPIQENVTGFLEVDTALSNIALTPPQQSQEGYHRLTIYP